MIKLITVIKKNFKLIIRSRISAMITILGPLLITLLVGLAFNNASQYSISIGVYSPKDTPLVKSFTDKLSEANFNLITLDNEQKCVDDIRQGEINLCMAFPENFQIANGNNSNVSNEITFYVDPSQINLVYGVIDMISSQVAERKTEISSQLTGVLLTTLDTTKRAITNQNPQLADIIQLNQNVQTKEISIKRDLSGLNLDFDANSFNVSKLKDVNKVIQDSFAGGLNSTIRLSVNKSLQYIDNVIYDLERSSFNKSDTYYDAVSIRSRLRVMDQKLDNLDDATLKQFAKTINQIEQELQETNSKFAEARSKRGSITTDITSISASLNTSLNKVMSIKGALDGILRSIDSIEVTQASSIVSPVRTIIKPLVTETYLNYMFPGLIALVMMLVTLLFAETTVMMEKRSKAYFRNLVTPTSDYLFLFAGFVTTMLLMLLQLVLILGVSTLVFKVDITANLFPTIIVLSLISTLFTVIGILVGVAFTSAETATLAAISIGSVSLFLSDIILPLESMPEAIVNIARYNPFVVSEYLLRKTILFKADLGSIAQDGYFNTVIPAVAILAMYILFFLGVLMVFTVVVKKQIISRYVLRLAPRPAERVVDITDKGLDPVAKTESLIQEAWALVKAGDAKKARILYVNLNELYTMLPSGKKRYYFDKIVELHKELDKKE